MSNRTPRHLTFLLMFATVLAASACDDHDRPEIRSVTPDTVSAAAGHPLVIEGKNFSADAEVLIGGSPARIVSATGTRIELLTPAGLAGPAEITVRTSRGADVASGALTRIPVDLRYDAVAEAVFPPSPSGPLARIVAVDLNFDGHPDVAALTAEGAFRVATNSGMGRFTWDETQDASSLLEGHFSTLEVTELDGDPSPELVLCGRTGTADTRLDFASDGSFTAAVLDLRGSFSLCHDLVPLPADATGRVSLLSWRSRPDLPGLRQLVLFRADAERHVLDEPSGTLANVTRPVTADLEGATGDFAASTERAAGGRGSGRFGYDFTAARGTLTVSFPLPALTWTPESVRFELFGDASGHTLTVALVDATGERFSQPGAALGAASWGTLELRDPAGGLASGGDGVFDLPPTTLELTLTASETGPATGAIFVDNLLLVGPGIWRHGITDFERPVTPVSTSDEVTATAWTHLDGLDPADVAFCTAPSVGNSQLFLADGASETGDWTPAGGLPLPIPRIRSLIPMDVDRDGDLDLVAIGQGQDQCLIHDGRGTFFNDTLSCLPVSRGDGRAARAADANLDGLPDLFVAAADGLCRLYEADGAGGFLDVTPVFGLACEGMTALALLDADGDGLIDTLFLDDTGHPALFLAGER
jgi:hypothetical protein